MPSLPIRVPGSTPLYRLRLSSVGRDLAQRAEQLGAELVVRVVAQVLLLDLDAGERPRVLEQVVERARGRRRCLIVTFAVRRLGDPLDRRAGGSVAATCRSRGRAGGRAARSVGSPAGIGGDRAPARRGRPRRRSRRRSRAARLASSGARPRAGGARARAAGRAAASRARSAAAQRLAVARRPPRARRRAATSGSDLHDRRGARRDQHLAVAVDDVAARRLDPHLAHAVLRAPGRRSPRPTAPAGTTGGRRRPRTARTRSRRARRRAPRAAA